MVSKVQVPMDFGVQYLGSPSHSNLKFCIANGAELLANSMIISYNSPVIERITTELMQTTIDVEDFTKEVVQCFLEASYSGELKKVSKSNFRDVNKMVHVFEVSWMVERSLGFFKSLVEEVSEENFEDQLFVFEEAMFVLITLKKRDFVDLVIKRFTSLLSCSPFFVTKYLTDLSTLSTSHLDVIIEMTRKQEYILMEVLVLHLEKNNSSFDSNSRYLFQNVSFTSCRATHNSLYHQFFDILERMETPSREDFSFIVKRLKQSDQALSNMRESNLQFAKIPNLFNEFKLIIEKYSELDELVNFLVDSPLVTNSYIFYDAVVCWLLERRIDGKSPYVTISDTFLETFADAMSKNGWEPLALAYMRDRKRRWLGGLVEKIIENKKLTTNMYSCISSITEYYSPDELFLNDHDIKFQFKHKSITNCNKAGDCGFILRVTAATDECGDSFDIQLIVDPNLYPTDIHFHDDTHSYVDMHLALQNNNGSSFPVSWYGKPRRDVSKTYWVWGPLRFYNEGDGVSRPPGYNYRTVWTCGIDAKIRPVVYYFG